MTYKGEPMIINTQKQNINRPQNGKLLKKKLNLDKQIVIVNMKEEKRGIFEKFIYQNNFSFFIKGWGNWVPIDRVPRRPSA